MSIRVTLTSRTGRMRPAIRLYGSQRQVDQGGALQVTSDGRYLTECRQRTNMVPMLRGLFPSHQKEGIPAGHGKALKKAEKAAKQSGEEAFCSYLRKAFEVAQKAGLKISRSEMLSSAIRLIVSRADNAAEAPRQPVRTATRARGVRSSVRRHGNKATAKAGSSGSSDPDPEPRRRYHPVILTRSALLQILPRLAVPPRWRIHQLISELTQAIALPRTDRADARAGATRLSEGFAS